MVEEIFFQSSLPRAGSTMLQNIFAQRPDMYATPTSGLLELLYGAQLNYTNGLEFKAQDAEQMKAAFLSFCKEGMFAFFKEITNKKYVIDKSRGWGWHYPFLNEFIETPKVVCMVRDLRDIYASMEKNFRKNPDKNSMLVDWSKLDNTTVMKRVETWSKMQPVGLAMDRLNDIFGRGLDQYILFVRYEDLCLYPQPQMTRIYQYLGISDFEHDFDNIEQVTKEDDEVYGTAGLHTIRKKLEMRPSDAKAILGREVWNGIWDSPNYKWFFEKFNYKK